MSSEKIDREIKDDATLDDSESYIDPVAEARALRKCDMVLMPLFTISFMSAYLDRSNVGNAQTAGLLKDLNMSTQQYVSTFFLLHLHLTEAALLTVYIDAALRFYVTYVVLEMPGSLIVKQIKPSRLLPLYMLGWSVTCLGTSFMRIAP